MIKTQAASLLNEWVREQLTSGTRRDDLILEANLPAQSAEFLNLFADAVDADASGDLKSTGWSAMRKMLDRVSASRTQHGFRPSEVATPSLVLGSASKGPNEAQRSVGTDLRTDLLWQTANVPARQHKSNQLLTRIDQARYLSSRWGAFIHEFTVCCA